MKIPETPGYYGNEENGQWQPNGVIIDSGVGGGVVGSGDAGVHRPSVYPVHIPRGHLPGYVMAGAYYPPGAYPPVPVQAPQPDDFSDYMWMENEEEFDKQVMQQLEEEALMEQCIEAMLEDEQRERRNNRPQVANGHNSHYPTTSNGAPSVSLEEAVSRSTLNPLAAEFVPTRARLPPPATDDRQEAQSTQAPSQETTRKTTEDEPVTTTTEKIVDSSTEVKAETTEETKTEEPVTPSKDPPEVSAADVQPIQENKHTDKKPKDAKTKTEAYTNANANGKKPVKSEANAKVLKVEAKAKKPLIVKSEPRIAPKRKEVKPVKSEAQLEQKREEVVVVPLVETPKPQPLPMEEPLSQSVPSGPKPINYAAAAKANKPKKPAVPTFPTTSPPIVEKMPSVQKRFPERKDKKVEKPGVQRKNSAK